jgi:N-acetylglucosamine kinase-like BadF-type ATPase
VIGVLAVDGGQSGIRVRHSAGERVAEVAGVSHLAHDAAGAVVAAIAQAWHELGEGVVDRAVLGLTTAPDEPGARATMCEGVFGATQAREVWLTGDAVTAHAGALSLGWGVSLTVGTGVACLAVPPLGEPRVFGGHGFLLGDDGGAYWIGREAIRAALRAHEGMAPPTALVSLIEQRLGPLEGLPTRVHSAARPVNEIARLAPDVLSIADAGDPEAARIADSTARELENIAVAASTWIHAGEAPVPVALGGRLIEPGSPLRRRLDLMLDAVPGIAARSAAGSPLDGALQLGLAGDPGRYAPLVHVWHVGQPA